MGSFYPGHPPKVRARCPAPCWGAWRWAPARPGGPGPGSRGERPVAAALGGLTSREATDPRIVGARLPPTRAVLGPAALFYPPAGFAAGDVQGVEQVPFGEARELFPAVAADDLDESGLPEVTGPLFASGAAGGGLAAVCGYRRWPNQVAHLSVLAHPGHRQEGHARRAAWARSSASSPRDRPVRRSVDDEVDDEVESGLVAVVRVDLEDR